MTPFEGFKQDGYEKGASWGGSLSPPEAPFSMIIEAGPHPTVKSSAPGTFTLPSHGEHQLYQTPSTGALQHDSEDFGNLEMTLPNQ